jgi:pyruvate formate lyase activating enzyme
MCTDQDRCTLCGTCVDACYAEAREMAGQVMTVDSLMHEIERDVAFFDESGGGVTFSGGEPLMQPAFLSRLLRACGERGIHTALDTCGFAPWETLDGIRGNVDLFLYDLKLMDDAQHLRFTGVSNGVILSNLQALSRHGHRITLRIPVIPGVNDHAGNIAQIGEYAAGLPCLQGLDLLPYHATALDKYARLNRVYGPDRIEPPSEPALTEIAERLAGYGLQVHIGG